MPGRVDHRLHRRGHGDGHRDDVNGAFAARRGQPPLGPVLVYTEDPIVSSDIVGSPASCTFDARLTMVQPVGRPHPGEGPGLVRQRVGVLPTGWSTWSSVVAGPGDPGVTGRAAAARRVCPSLEDLPDVDGERVLVRTDFNVPLHDGPDGRPGWPTTSGSAPPCPPCEWLLEPGGRGDGLQPPGPARRRPRPPLGHGPGAPSGWPSCAPGSSSSRTCGSPRGEGERPGLRGRSWSTGFDGYVNEAFGVAHRRPRLGRRAPDPSSPAPAGRRLAREVEVLGALLDDPARPFVAVVGGAKVADKLGVLQSRWPPGPTGGRGRGHGLHLPGRPWATRWAPPWSTSTT